MKAKYFPVEMQGDVVVSASVIRKLSSFSLSEPASPQTYTVELFQGSVCINACRSVQRTTTEG